MFKKKNRVNSSPTGQICRRFADDIFICNFMNEKFLLKFVPKGPINNNPDVWLMAWRRIGDKSLSEPMLTQFTDAFITVGRQLPSMLLSPTKMADAPNGRNKQSRFFLQVDKRYGYFKDSLQIDWLFKHLYSPRACMSEHY